MPTWETATDWDNATSESGVAHESVANTDHSDDTIVEQGYSYGSFDDITPTPFAAYPFHEDSGSTAYDVAGSADGTINGATLGVPGLLGTTAHDYDGADDYTDLGDPGLEGLSTFTVTMWVNLDDASGTGNTLINGGPNNNDTLIFGINSGSWRFRLNSGGVDTTGGSPTTGSWDFLVWRYESGNSAFYENASQVFTAGHDGALNSSGATLKIAGRGDKSFVDGQFADVRLYDTGLTGTEIQTLYDVVTAQSSLTTATKSL